MINDIKNTTTVDPQVLKEAKDLFISLAAHKLLTPTTVIKWNVEILSRKEGLDPKIKEKLADIGMNAKKLEDFSNVLVKIISLNSGDRPASIEPKNYDLYDVFLKILSEFNESISGKIQVKIQNNLKKILKLEIDEFTFNHVLRSFIKNAISYTNSITPVIEVGCEIKDTHLIIYVKDNGIGISDREKPLIFQPFFRTVNSQKLSVKGNGLDLYVSMLSLNYTNSKIWFESNEGTGTIFYLSVPFSESVESANESK